MTEGAPAPVGTPAARDPRVVMAAVVAVAWFTVPFACSLVLFARLAEVTDWLRSLGDGAPWAAAALFAAVAGLGLLPTYAQAVLMGWVFGTATGALVSVGGYMGGAVLGSLASAAVVGDAVARRIDAHPRWRVVRGALVDSSPVRTAMLVGLLRFPPNSPFAFTNLVLAAARVGFVPMFVGSFLGMLPRTVIAVWVGAQGASTGARDLKELMERQGLVWVVVGFGLLAVALAVMQHIGKRALRAAGLDAGGTLRP